ncbi:hypothetical protein EIP91_009505 [Steccherinum ochraceum]|uniref:Uncharacterized protein n=1 Tax=Steccherinum ochraceum TaxID=92696 RepID=A0A4R0R704_9APHY|nr:hypothetical protein EIP91_009505 [Steccherinum ochraceum]
MEMMDNIRLMMRHLEQPDDTASGIALKIAHEIEKVKLMKANCDLKSQLLLQLRQLLEHGLAVSQCPPPEILVEYAMWTLVCPNLIYRRQYSDDHEPLPEPIVAFLHDDLLRESTWINNLLIDCYTQCTAEARALVGFRPKTREEEFNQLLAYRTNLAFSYITSGIDQCTDGLSQMEIAMKEHSTFLQTIGSPHITTPWKHNHSWLYVHYAIMRVDADVLDLKTKEALETALCALQMASPSYSDLELDAIVVRAGFAIVLLALDVDEEQQKEHTSWTVTKLRKRPHFKHQVLLHLRPSKTLVHPVLKALGEAWFFAEDDIIPETKERFKKWLSQCLLLELDWPTHKSDCRKNEEINDRLNQSIAQGKFTSSFVHRKSFMHLWLDTSQHYANQDALIHALSLCRDMTRSITHMVFRVVKPDSDRTVRSRDIDRIYVHKCGVFKIPQILPDLTRMIRRERIQYCLHQMSQAQASLGDDGDPWAYALVATFVCMKGPVKEKDGLVEEKAGWSCHLRLVGILKRAIMDTRHDPTWREKTNRIRPPPGAVILPSGIQDAEFDYQTDHERRETRAQAQVQPLVSPRLLAEGIRRMVR